jgi:hypothetical protein
MKPRQPRGGSDPSPDPFAEHEPQRTRAPLQLLGGRFHFESGSPELLRLVDWAYAGLPAHELSGRTPDFKVRLVLNGAGPRLRGRREPPDLTLVAGAGFLGGVAGPASFVALSPRERGALVVVAREMLGFPYHARYELIEFAVFTLAARAQQLLPLHAACVSREGRGLLLMGPSGAGKSTVALHCLLRGLDFVAEDAVFVAAKGLLATGIANFLHVCPDTLRWLSGPQARVIRAAPTIRRRSGVRKYEVDLRRSGHRLAATPAKLSGLVFLSPKPGGKTLLRELSAREVRTRLAAAQPYAAGQPQWRRFAAGIEQRGGFELRRGRHPQDSAAALHELLAATP